MANGNVDKRALRFGTFIVPFHDVRENLTLALERDMQLIQHLEQLGFAEAWVGEHHSGGFECIASPELFIAGVAERTSRIKLGTGVVSLPYHGPLSTADRIAQLDHQTRGRLIFGIGPGSLPSDVHMFGRDPLQIREIAESMLEVIMPLLRGEKVTRKTDFYNLRDAVSQIGCYQHPHPELVIAAVASPYGPSLAGKLGASLISISATSQAGFEALANTWDIWSTSAAKHGQTVSRASWRLVGPVHIAETREQARQNVAHGLRTWVRYMKRVSVLPVSADIEADLDVQIDAMNSSGLAVIGTPDDLIRKIDTLWEKSGGFGAWVDLHHDWADFEQTKRSYELIARYVMPHFSGSNQRRIDSLEWAAASRDEHQGFRAQAVQKEVDRWAKVKATS
jgi:limonene 1,2-monooxygenase